MKTPNKFLQKRKVTRYAFSGKSGSAARNETDTTTVVTTSLTSTHIFNK